MEIQGSPERMLDSVLPHEVTHTIFATHFGCPLPRWADEGACTTVEHPGEVARMEGELIKFLKTRRGIRFSDMMWMKQYPHDFMPLYAQGHSVAAYLIGLKGKQAFVRFLEDGLTDDNWPRAAKKHFGYANLAEMQEKWLGWVRAGRPPLTADEGASARLISHARPAQRKAGRQVVRGQGDSITGVTVAAGAEEPMTESPPASSPLAVEAGTGMPRPAATQPIARVLHETPAPTAAASLPAAQSPVEQQVAPERRTVFEWHAPASSTSTPQP
jgi:hypothetical protein